MLGQDGGEQKDMRTRERGATTCGSEEDLRLTFFIAGDVHLPPRNEFSKFFPARRGMILSVTSKVGNVIRS